MQMQVGDTSQQYVWVGCVISAEAGLSATSTVVSNADCKCKRCGTGIGSFDESHPDNTQALKPETTHIWHCMLKEKKYIVSHAVVHLHHYVQNVIQPDIWETNTNDQEPKKQSHLDQPSLLRVLKCLKPIKQWI